MSTDYFPRLSKVNSNSIMANQVVNQQIEVALLLLLPLLVLLSLILPFVIQILYTESFVVIEKLIQWAIVGILFKALSWAISYLFLARSAKLLFIINEVAVNGIMLFTTILGYNSFKLEGIGMAYTGTYGFYFLLVLFGAYSFHGFNISFSSIKISLVSLLLVSIVVAVNLLDLSIILISIICIPVLLFAILFSLYELEKRMGIMTRIRPYKK